MLITFGSLRVKVQAMRKKNPQNHKLWLVLQFSFLPTDWLFPYSSFLQ